MKRRSSEKPQRPEALRTRRRLLDAGRKAFAAKGLGGVSLREDILARAGVSTGSFYHQFSDKEDLLLELLRNDGAAVLEALAKSREPEGADPSQAPRRRDRLLHALFDMADGYPEFVKIYVREYHSDSARVRREIRAHRDRTIAGVKPYYESLRNLTGLPLDVDAIATLLSVQSFSLISYYIELPKSDRAATRERLIRGMIQLGSGGILAMLEEEGGSTGRSGGSGVR